MHTEKMKKTAHVLMLLCLLFISAVCRLEGADGEDDGEGIRMSGTMLQAGLRMESMTKKGTPRKVIYREKVFDYFIEPFYPRAAFNLIPDAKFITGLDLGSNARLSTELGFSYFLNDYMVYNKEYSAANYDYPSWAWHPTLTGGQYLASGLVKFETLNEDEELNATVQAGRIYPEYTPLTLKKRHNGLMAEISGENAKLFLTGSRLADYGNAQKYLFSSRLELDNREFGGLGISFVNSWYRTGRLEEFRETEYYRSRESGGAALYLKFSDRSPWDKSGANLRRLRIEADFDGAATNYTLLDDFSPGSAPEKKYLFESSGLSQMKGEVRYADLSGFFIYRIILPDRAKSIRVTSEIAGDYRIDTSLDGRKYTLLSASENPDDTASFQTVSGAVALWDVPSSDSYVYLKVADETPADGYGGVLFKIEFYEDDRLSLSFEPSSESGSDESRYLYRDYYSVQRTENGSGIRLADGSGYFIYRFPVRAGTGNIRFRMLLKNDFRVTAYQEGQESRSQVLSSQGRETEGMNLGYYDLCLSSYQDIYDNASVPLSRKVLGLDYRLKILGADLYLEADMLLAENMKSSMEKEVKKEFAFLARVEKNFSAGGVKIKAQVHRIGAGYDVTEFVDENDDADQYVNELEPFTSERQYVNYDPLLDPYNENRNFMESFSVRPVITYAWSIDETAYLGMDQQGVNLALEKERLFSHFRTGLYYVLTEELGEPRAGQKVVYKLKFTEPFPRDSALDNEYRLEYIRDDRSVSANADNLKNFFKFIYTYYGLKNLNWQIGVNQIYVNKDLEREKTDLTAEFLNSLKYTIPVFNDLIVEPAYMVKFYRYFQFAPDHETHSRLIQHFLGGDVNYRFLKDFSAYGIYRVLYTDDRLYPANNNFLHIAELGLSRPGKVFFRTGCNYTVQFFIDRASRTRDWETLRLFSEVRSYF